MPNQKSQEAKQAGRLAGHTPGPWFVRKDREFYRDHPQPLCVANHKDQEAYDEHPDPKWICRLFDAWGPEAEANAALIAAAPDLLAALKGLQKQIHAHYKMNVKKDFSLMLADAEAGKAIAKAEGQA